MSSTTIQLPEGFVSNILESAGGIFTTFSGVITLIVGVLLAALVIEIIIGALRK